MKTREKSEHRGRECENVDGMYTKIESANKIPSRRTDSNRWGSNYLTGKKRTESVLGQSYINHAFRWVSEEQGAY